MLRCPHTPLLLYDAVCRAEAKRDIVLLTGSYLVSEDVGFFVAIPTCMTGHPLEGDVGATGPQKLEDLPYSAIKALSF